MLDKAYPGGTIQTVQELAPQAGFRSYVVTYPSDGLQLRSLLNVPTGTPPPGGWPIVVFNHGYIAPQQYRTTGGDYRYWIDGLTRAGYIVAKPDYRGHDQSPGQATGGNFAPEYTTDVLNLTNSLRQYPGANPTRVGMVGHSMGGGITMRAATIDRGISAAITLAGVVGTADDLYYGWRRATPPPGASFGSGRQQLTERYGEPRQNEEVWKTLLPINYVSELAGTLQVHHSADDGEVPKQFSDSLVAAARQAGRPVEYYEYSTGGHQFEGTGGTVLTRMVAALDARLK